MNSAKQSLRPTLAAMLCGALSLGTMPLAASATVAKSAAARKLDKDAQVDLLLSRFTFGPTAFDKQAATRQVVRKKSVQHPGLHRFTTG